MAKKAEYGPPSTAGIVMFYDVKASKIELEPKKVIFAAVLFSAILIMLQVI